jgi:hypothetical protein
MNGADAIVALAFSGVLIGLLVSGAEMFKRWIAYKEAKLGAGRDQSALEERLRVLERIVTERHNPLADEIEALRHAPAETGVPLALEKERV